MTAYSNTRRDDTRRDERPRGAYPPRDDQRQGRAQTVAVTEPTPCNVTTNLFKYKGKHLILHQYAVTFTPEIFHKNIFNKFLQIVEMNGFKEPYAFDGVSILVSTKKFPDTVFKAPLRDGTELQCRIEYKHTHDSTVLTGDISGLMQCMEIISRYYQKILFCVDKKRMFFPKSRPFDLGAGLEVVPGLTSTIKLNKDGFYLNLDAAFGVFHKAMPLVDLLVDVARSKDSRRGPALDPLRDDMGTNFYYDFEKFIKNLKIETVHREKNSSFKVSGLLLQPASSVEFEIDGTKWTVASYFAKTYAPLKYPHLPLLVVKKGAIAIHLPLEVLRICPTQKYSRKLDENMTASMIKIAAKRPKERFDMIHEKAIELSALQNDTLIQFGMAFDNQMLNCKGVILPAPKIAFAENKRVFVNNGSWNLIGARALQGTQIDDWKIFSFRSSDTIRDDAIHSFIDLAARYGVTIKPRPAIAVVRNMNEFYEAKKAKFNLVVLPDKNSQRYEEVKRIAETYNGVFTQCIVASNISKLTNPSFVSNLLLKINVKLGGRNWGVDKTLFQDKPTILFGIDVNHPGVADLESPSIVSIVASMDYGFIHYKTIIEQQERRQEIIMTLKENVKSMLKSHYASTKNKPARIVVFRDGVGDSMFNTVYNCEIEAIEAACTDLDASYKPEINFVIAQKRHSVRFKCDGNNLVPGTVVDEIGSPGLFDFYLVSHHALQGTARPVRYILFRNDSRFSNMEIYEATYNLCHLYARATKAVGVVAPVYYAHLAAARGKCYLEKNKDGAVVMRACDKEIQKNLYYL